MTLNRNYVSEVDRFINNLLQQQPQLITKQKQLRATWWDKELDSEELQSYAASSVPNSGYAYY